ncbi:MAG: hypothetical protein UT45_C0004G0036 [Candidatus Daviesbacteria bacterium GW2011_GWA2_39_33]|nr:MAG: hypothetical protein UT45_C0004G0036 [Candidatus Daviesbacteria bacterium GW2011_GWA2_39_33]
MNKQLPAEAWGKTGFYPTPDPLVKQFSDVVNKYLKGINFKKNVSVLDLFAGDGRLGLSIGQNLLKSKHLINTTYVEVEKDQIPLINKTVGNPRILRKNVFDWQPKNKFTLIISNPPYLILNYKEAERLGFNWNSVKGLGRNLYTLGIAKGLELLEEGGILAVISPFSWLRGEFSDGFRKEINKQCSSVFIKANDHRTIFKGVNQDIGIQIFQKKTSHNMEIATDWKFGYNGDKPKQILFRDVKYKKENSHSRLRIMVGPVVWNRKKEFLKKNFHNASLVVYGGNIGHDGKLYLNDRRYLEKQYIQNKALTNNDTFDSPLILIRRIMRGIPGNWKIDSCFIKENFVCTAENHVIVVALPADKVDMCGIFHEKLMQKIKDYYYLSGSPSISGKVVKRIAMDLEKTIVLHEPYVRQSIATKEVKHNFIYTSEFAF